VIDDNELVRVTLIEVENEFNFSNPTNYFNLTLPHIAIKQNAFQSMTYSQYKQAMRETDQKEVADNEQSATSSEDATAASSTAEEETLKGNIYFDNPLKGPMLLRVLAQNKTNSKLKIHVALSSPNLAAPLSSVKDVLIDKNPKCVGHFQKKNPFQDFGEI